MYGPLLIGTLEVRVYVTKPTNSEQGAEKCLQESRYSLQQEWADVLEVSRFAPLEGRVALAGQKLSSRFSSYVGLDTYQYRVEVCLKSMIRKRLATWDHHHMGDY